MTITLPIILPLISAVLVFSLGVFVFFKNRKSNLNTIFFLLSIAITVWLFSTFMLFFSKTDNQAIFWDRTVYIGVVFIATLMYHFSLVFSKIRKFKLLYLGYFLSFIFLALSRTDYFVSDLFRYEWGVHTKAQFFHHIFLAYFSIYLFLFYYNIYHYYRTIKGVERSQSKYIFIAFLVLLVGALGYLPAYGIGIYPFAYVSGVVFSVILAYAIVVHRLMDIKLVMRRSTVYLATILTIVLPAFAVLFFGLPLFPDFLVLVNLILLILAVSVFTALRNFYYRLANKYFFSSLYDSSQVIGKLSDKLRSTLDIDKIYEFIADTLTDAFHSKAVGVLLRQEQTGDYLVQYNQGFNIGQQMRFKGDSDLEEEFARHNKSLVVEELKGETYKSKKPLFELLTGLDVAILTPLNIKDRTIGLIALASKESKDMYNDEDLRVLEVVGAQSAIAIDIFY